MQKEKLLQLLLQQLVWNAVISAIALLSAYFHGCMFLLIRVFRVYAVINHRNNFMCLHGGTYLQDIMNMYYLYNFVINATNLLGNKGKQLLICVIAAAILLVVSLF